MTDPRKGAAVIFAAVGETAVELVGDPERAPFEPNCSAAQKGAALRRLATDNPTEAAQLFSGDHRVLRAPILERALDWLDHRRLALVLVATRQPDTEPLTQRLRDCADLAEALARILPSCMPRTSFQYEAPIELSVRPSDTEACLAGLARPVADKLRAHRGHIWVLQGGGPTPLALALHLVVAAAAAVVSDPHPLRPPDDQHVGPMARPTHQLVVPLTGGPQAPIEGAQIAARRLIDDAALRGMLGELVGGREAAELAELLLLVPVAEELRVNAGVAADLQARLREQSWASLPGRIRTEIGGRELPRAASAQRFLRDNVDSPDRLVASLHAREALADCAAGRYSEAVTEFYALAEHLKSVRGDPGARRDLDDCGLTELRNRALFGHGITGVSPLELSEVEGRLAYRLGLRSGSKGPTVWVAFLDQHGVSTLYDPVGDLLETIGDELGLAG